MNYALFEVHVKLIHFYQPSSTASNPTALGRVPVRLLLGRRPALGRDRRRDPNDSFVRRLDTETVDVQRKIKHRIQSDAAPLHCNAAHDSQR